MANGMANLQKLSLVSDGGWGYMKGKVDMLKKNYDLQLKVVPNLTSSVPLIVGFVGGPVIGIVAWALNKVLAPHVNEVAQKNYIITGSWDNPKITAMSAFTGHV